MGEIAVPDLHRDTLRIARSAGMAPSHHNSQPWSLSVRADQVEVWVEPARRPTVSDPDGRQSLIGVGAAVYAIRLELGELGWLTDVDLFPDAGRPDLVARVRVTGARPNPPLEHRLWQQLPRRRTVRSPLWGGVPSTTRRALALHVAVEGCGLRWVEAEQDRHALAALIAVADREQHRDPLQAAEVATWTSDQTLDAGAGIPTYAMAPAAARAGEFPLRAFREGPPAGGLPPRPEPEQAIAVLVSSEDGPADWLRAGQALMRMLLAGTVEGLAAAYLNQPLEERGARAQVASELGLAGPAQMVIRLGRPGGVWPPAPPRRPPAELVRLAGGESTP